MTTQTPTVTIDGQPVPLDQVVWLERRRCGCTTAATAAVVNGQGGWLIATADEAIEHWNPTEREQAIAAEAGRTALPVTGATYRAEYTGDWFCTTHRATKGGAR